MSQRETAPAELMLPTLAGGQAAIPVDAVESLRSRMSGNVLTPSDPGYGTVRPVFNAMHPDRPALVARCRSTADVVEVVQFARANRLPVTVRGGGHSVAGLSSSVGGLVVDLAEMNGVQVDPEARTARVQGGALWRDVDQATQEFGLATPGGEVSDTGVAGLTLGGGYGYLRRMHGLASDNVLAAEVVCADGQVRTASATDHADLFWAVRGGGGNFGIVTGFTFRLHPVGPRVASVGVFYPVRLGGDLLRGFRDFCDRAPDELAAEAIAITMPADPDLPEAIHEQPCWVIGGFAVGDPAEGMAALQPLRELAEPLADLSEPAPYIAVQSEFDPFFERQTLQCYWKSLYLRALTDDVIDLLAAKARERPAPLTLLNVQQLGGALNRVGSTETAFAERSAQYMISVDGIWTDPGDNAANIAWVRETWTDLGRFGTGSTYLNFTGYSGERTDVGVSDAFGENLRRLADLKATYDPDNVFRRNNNILPAPRAGGSH
jgi:hypothetical protein